MIENTGNKKSRIAFMGTVEYRDFLHDRARKLKTGGVQGLLEKAVAAYFADKGADSDTLSNPATKSTEKASEPVLQLKRNPHIEAQTLNAAKDLLVLLQNGAKLAEKLEYSLSEQTVGEANRAVSAVPEKLRRGGARLGKVPGNPKVGKKHAG